MIIFDFLSSKLSILLYGINWLVNYKTNKGTTIDVTNLGLFIEVEHYPEVNKEWVINFKLGLLLYSLFLTIEIRK